MDTTRTIGEHESSEKLVPDFWSLLFEPMGHLSSAMPLG